MKLAKAFQTATTALLTNTLYGISTEDKITEFMRSECSSIYLLNITRKLQFFTTESPTTALFVLEIPYLVELNIEDDIETIVPEIGLENFWYSIKEVSSEIKMYDCSGVEINLSLTIMKSKEDIDWMNKDFLHGLCHATVFGDLLSEEDPDYTFNERPNTKGMPFLMNKLNLEQWLLLDLKCVINHEKMLN